MSTYGRIDPRNDRPDESAPHLPGHHPTPDEPGADHHAWRHPDPYDPASAARPPGEGGRVLMAFHADAGPGGASPRSVLIVDDHGDIGRALKHLLKRHGYDAEYVTSGPEGLASVARSHPGLVILDVMMPEMSGLDVLRELRSNPDTSATKVVMYSASDDAATRREAANLGAKDYLLKGHDWDEIVTRIDSLFAA